MPALTRAGAALLAGAHATLESSRPFTARSRAGRRRPRLATLQDLTEKDALIREGK
jgi:hypothetical protein